MGRLTRTLSRRALLKGLSAAPFAPALLRTASGPAHAQSWPSGSITMIVPFPPGGQADLAARPIADALQRILGATVVIENRSGAGGAIGNAAAAKAAPDGQTLLMTLSSLAVLPVAARLFDRPPLYEVSQLRPVARVLADPTMLAVPAKAPWKTVADLVADAKAKPSTIASTSSTRFRPFRHLMRPLPSTLRIQRSLWRTAPSAQLLTRRIAVCAASLGTKRKNGPRFAKSSRDTLAIPSAGYSVTSCMQ